MDLANYLMLWSIVQRRVQMPQVPEIMYLVDDNGSITVDHPWAG